MWSLVPTSPDHTPRTSKVTDIGNNSLPAGALGLTPTHMPLRGTGPQLLGRSARGFSSRRMFDRPMSMNPEIKTNDRRIRCSKL